MKKKKEKTTDHSPVMPALGEAVFTPPEPSLGKVGGLQISTAFFRAVYEQEGWDTPLNFSKAPLQQDKDVWVFTGLYVKVPSANVISYVN